MSNDTHLDSGKHPDIEYTVCGDPVIGHHSRVTSNVHDVTCSRCLLIHALDGTDFIILTREECKAIHSTVSELSGCNPEYVFSAYSVGEEDDPNDPNARAFAKVYQAAGRQVPDNLRDLK
jgi:hypothetical protein